jgi:hypothetical protein
MQNKIISSFFQLIWPAEHFPEKKRKRKQPTILANEVGGHYRANKTEGKKPLQIRGQWWNRSTTQRTRKGARMGRTEEEGRQPAAAMWKIV